MSSKILHDAIFNLRKKDEIMFGARFNYSPSYNPAQQSIPQTEVVGETSSSSDCCITRLFKACLPCMRGSNPQEREPIKLTKTINSSSERV